MELVIVVSFRNYLFLRFNDARIYIALVAISRTMDNRHHWHDVLVGSSLGLFIASLCYLQYFNPLTSPNCHEALPPRHLFHKLSRDPEAASLIEDDSTIQLRPANQTYSTEDV